MYGTTLFVSVTGFYLLGSETPIQRRVRLYREHPSTKLRRGPELRLGLVPGPGSATMFGFSGTF